MTFIVLWVYTFIYVFIGCMLSFYQYKNNKLRQTLHTGPSRKRLERLVSSSVSSTRTLFFFSFFKCNTQPIKAGRAVKSSICSAYLFPLAPLLSAFTSSSSPEGIPLPTQEKKRIHWGPALHGDRVSFTSNAKSQLIYLRCCKGYEEDAEGYFTCSGVAHGGDTAALCSCWHTCVARAPSVLPNDSRVARKSRLAVPWSWSFGHKTPATSWEKRKVFSSSRL